MLIPFGIVLGTGIFFIFCAIRRARHQNPLNQSNDTNFTAPPVMDISSGFRSSLFEQPCRWLAIKGHNPLAVQAALDLHHPQPCSCEEGLVEAREDKLFISPPISGWILVVGSGLPEPSEDVDLCFHFLHDLSRKLGHVQFFSANRVLNHHAWVLIEKGHVFRAYAWAGETLWNQGQITAAEKELELLCFDYGSNQNVFILKESLSNNSEKVNHLAARWSLDPGAISESAWNAARGIVGEFSQSKPH